jgi:hypothetical protein
MTQSFEEFYLSGTRKSGKLGYTFRNAALLHANLSRACMITDLPIFKFKRGGHVCLFYHDETTLLEFLVPFICEGLRLGEKCFLVQPTSIVHRLPFALSIAGVSYKKEVARKALDLQCTEDVYLKTGNFDVHAMMDGLERTIAEALAAGFKGVRTAGDLGWASTTNLSHETLLLYERLVQRTFPHRQAIGICQYPIAMFPGKLLEEVLSSHQASIQQPQKHSNHSCLSIHNNSYTLDVVADRLQPQSTVYYVVQKQGSANILGWGAEATVENAIRMGQELIPAS